MNACWKTLLLLFDWISIQYKHRLFSNCCLMTHELTPCFTSSMITVHFSSHFSCLSFFLISHPSLSPFVDGIGRNVWKAFFLYFFWHYRVNWYRGQAWLWRRKQTSLKARVTLLNIKNSCQKIWNSCRKLSIFKVFWQLNKIDGYSFLFRGRITSRGDKYP